MTPKIYEATPPFPIGWRRFLRPSRPAACPSEGIREKLGIGKSETVLLWGGGIWNWFDPLSLIRAIAKLARVREDIKLVFMGLRHPNDLIPEMKIAQEAVSLAEELNLKDKQIFFNFGWTPYEGGNHF